jgi:dTDP-4-dehydrorhamnose 3,5-epimerase
VRCVTGALYDVIVDIRPDSPTHLQSFGVELTAENGRALYVPKGFAHGFLTLLPDTTATTWSTNSTRPRPKVACATTIDWPLGLQEGLAPGRSMVISPGRTRHGNALATLMEVDVAP